MDIQLFAQIVENQNKKKKKTKNLWRWWAKAIGEKESKCDKESDKIAIIRTVIFLTYLITNCFIIYGVLRAHHFPTEVRSGNNCYCK